MMSHGKMSSSPFHVIYVKESIPKHRKQPSNKQISNKEIIDGELYVSVKRWNEVNTNTKAWRKAATKAHKTANQKTIQHSKCINENFSSKCYKRFENARAKLVKEVFAKINFIFPLDITIYDLALGQEVIDRNLRIGYIIDFSDNEVTILYNQENVIYDFPFAFRSVQLKIWGSLLNKKSSNNELQSINKKKKSYIDEYNMKLATLKKVYWKRIMKQ